MKRVKAQSSCKTGERWATKCLIFFFFLYFCYTLHFFARAVRRGHERVIKGSTIILSGHFSHFNAQHLQVRKVANCQLPAGGSQQAAARRLRRPCAA